MSISTVSKQIFVVRMSEPKEKYRNFVARGLFVTRCEKEMKMVSCFDIKY